jgi:hypothetical protein
MQERSLRKAAAVAGVVSVVLLTASVVLTLGGPQPDQPATKIVKWYADNRGVVFTSGMFTGLSMVAFFGFLGYLHHLSSSLVDARRALASILLASGVATETIAAIGAMPSVALAVTASRPGAVPSESVVRTLQDLNFLSGTFISVGVALFLAVLGLLIAHGVFSPRWAAWVAYVGAVLSLIGGTASIYVSKSGKPNIASLLGLLGLLLFVITVAAISVNLLRDRTPAAA